jgi:hypothetical protein
MIALQKSGLIFMPKSIILRGVVLLCAVVSPVLVCAQFQQPTDEELKMTADPKAPGAAAVYLDYEEIANDPLHYESTYARIKVLTEKGKTMATVELPYFLKGSTKITGIKGRTIQPDGTIVPLTVKPEELVAVMSRLIGRSLHCPASKSAASWSTATTWNTTTTLFRLQRGISSSLTSCTRRITRLRQNPASCPRGQPQRAARISRWRIAADA